MTLVSFTEELLNAVQPWFQHPEVRRRLGGPEWPERELRTLHTRDVGEFRGRTVLRTHSYDASRPDVPVISAVESGPAMGLAYVVDPTRWRQGIGRAVLQAVVQHPSVQDVRLFTAGIDADNEASRRCAAAAGFTAEVEEPDWEDTVYYQLRR